MSRNASKRPPRTNGELLTESTKVTNPIFRRRRKRSRPAENEKQLLVTKSSTTTVPNLDDTSLSFLDNNGDFLADHLAVQASIPILLEERRLGQWNGRSKCWQQQTLKCHIKKPPPGHPRRNWRSFSQRAIPFTHLGTPHEDAVLAMDRQGSFVLSLGSKDARNTPLALAIRFYEISSPSGILAKRKTHTGATLLQTVPVLYEILDESLDDAIFNFRRGISPATTPIKILVSNDWRMGVAMVQPCNVWREEGRIGTLVLFSTPRCVNSLTSKVTIWQCSNVRMGADASFSQRNLLWRVAEVPIVDQYATCIVETIRMPGYLFLHDEEDGFRLTWATEDWSNVDVSSLVSKLSDSSFSASIDSETPILTFETTWERFDSELWSGERILPMVGKPAGVNILCEGFLHVQVLLNDILCRRKGMSEKHPSEFVYNLISITNGGRVAEIIITFIRTQRPGSLGVFVEVDLFSGIYQERNWVKNSNSRDPVTLRGWCNTLALNQRMKRLRLGPYSVQSSQAIDWSKLCIESDFDPDQDDDFCPTFWGNYVDSKEEIATRKPPKFISLSTLYQDCDLITNKAITDCIPAKALRGRDSPIELIYG